MEANNSSMNYVYFLIKKNIPMWLLDDDTFEF